MTYTARAMETPEYPRTLHAVLCYSMPVLNSKHVWPIRVKLEFEIIEGRVGEDRAEVSFKVSAEISGARATDSGSFATLSS